MKQQNNSVIVFIDMLGVRDKWAKFGRDGAEDAFQRFRNLIAHSLKELSSEEIINGIIETDALVLVCSSVDAALKFAKKIYVDSFEQTIKNENNRIWLRGVIIPQVDGETMRWETNFKTPYDKVKIMLYSKDLFDAIALEKSGIKGMRLIIDNQLVSEDVRKKWILKIGMFNFITLKKLRNSLYPSRLEDKYKDFLWMASIDDDINERMNRIMALRLRKSASSSEEFVQAAATQLLFHEYSAMMGTLKKRQYFELLKQTEKKAD